MQMIAEYVWVDGSQPTRKLRSKTRILTAQPSLGRGMPRVSEFPDWSFDGSSTSQATGQSSDCILRPVYVAKDPIRGENAYLVLCEVFDAESMEPHESNTRAELRGVLDRCQETLPAFGFEQEYTLFEGSRPLGFPADRRFPAAQGPYYCGVGSDEVSGRALVEMHMRACMDAGLSISGVNAEVMPGQWEFQVGGPSVDGLRASDDLWLARWLLYRIGEDFGISATIDPKPVTGDWNGAGLHTNFSTSDMRHDSGCAAVIAAAEKIGRYVAEHLAVYGDSYEMRLTGAHETCHYSEYKFGVADRTASVRIPRQVHLDGCGYLEDRRPNANADPYEVSAVILKSVCDLHD